MGDYPSNRKSPVRLTANEEYIIYKYAMENHCLAQEGDLFNFRVEPHRVATEINRDLAKIFAGREIRSGHVKGAVESVIGWQARLGKLPIVPIETVELEQLREGKLRMVKEMEQLKADLETMRVDLNRISARETGYLAEIERLKKPSDAHKMLERIRTMVSV